MDLAERLEAVEAALKLQLEVGTSHLQAVEMTPHAFGLASSSRPAIKAIRKRRNAARDHWIDEPRVHGDHWNGKPGTREPGNTKEPRRDDEPSAHEPGNNQDEPGNNPDRTRGQPRIRNRSY